MCCCPTRETLILGGGFRTVAGPLLYERAEIYASELELQVKLLKETQAALEQTQSRSRGTGS
jgi:hypothetical protein